MDEQEKIANCYQEMYRGMIDKNRAVLDKVLADSFVLVHMTGMRQTKEAFIRALEDVIIGFSIRNTYQITLKIELMSSEPLRYNKTIPGSNMM